MDTSLVSEQERQSPEAVSRLESITFPLDELESGDAWSPVLLELPGAASSLGLAGPPVGLEEGLEESHLCSPEPVLVSGVKFSVWSSPCVDLCSLPTSTYGEVM